jgi:hypothetical protein
VRLLGVISSSISKVVTLIDNFTRTTSGSLGNTWSNIIGTWYANGSKAQNDTVSSNVGLTAATAGGANPVVLADVDADNVGVAFWVTDSNNYWAASVNQAIITNYTYGSSCATYSSQGYNYTYSCTGYGLLTGYTRYGATYVSASQVCTSPTRYGCAAYSWAVCSSFGRYGACTGYSATSGTQTCISSSAFANSYQSVCNSYQQVVTNTTYSGGTRTFNLIKKVGGTVSTVYSKVITAAISSYKIVSTTSGWLWVRAFPSASQSGTETISYLSQPSSPTKGTKHGLYIDLSGYVQTKTADNVSITGSSSSDIYTGTASVSGGTLYSDDTYYYRLFTGNGTLTVSNSDLKCDVLIGAGGGGGGSTAAGGSGGGSYTSDYVATPGSYAFVIGAVGNNSTGIGITAYAGGAPTTANGTGNNGGSGGGVYRRTTCPGSSSGGTATKASGGTITYGNNGAGAYCGTYFTGGGGGGGWGSAGYGQSEPGCPGTNCYGQGGNGGDGSTAYTNWCAAVGIGELYNGSYYLGAGAGGESQSNGQPGKGTGGNSSGYNGSGFVIVRYLKSAVA